MENDPNLNPILDVQAEPVVDPQPVDPVPAPEEALPVLEVYSKEQVEKLLESARKQEKDKLYKELQKKDTAISDLKEQIKNKDAEIKVLSDELNLIKDASLSQDQLVTKKIEGLEKLIKSLEEAREKDKLEAESEIRKAKLQVYRKELLISANGRVIEGLVVGETEEELNESFEMSKQTYESILADAKSTTPPQPNVVKQPPVIPSTNPASQQSHKKWTVEEVRTLSPEDWAKHSSEIKKQLGL